MAGGVGLPLRVLVDGGGRSQKGQCQNGHYGERAVYVLRALEPDDNGGYLRAATRQP